MMRQGKRSGFNGLKNNALELKNKELKERRVEAGIKRMHKLLRTAMLKKAVLGWCAQAEIARRRENVIRKVLMLFQRHEMRQMSMAWRKLMLVGITHVLGNARVSGRKIALRGLIVKANLRALHQAFEKISRNRKLMIDKEAKDFRMVECIRRFVRVSAKRDLRRNFCIWASFASKARAKEVAWHGACRTLHFTLKRCVRTLMLKYLYKWSAILRSFRAYESAERAIENMGTTKNARTGTLYAARTKLACKMLTGTVTRHYCRRLSHFFRVMAKDVHRRKCKLEVDKEYGYVRDILESFSRMRSHGEDAPPPPSTSSRMK